MSAEQFLPPNESGKDLPKLIPDTKHLSANIQQPPRILIAEDERLVAEDLKEVLENAGYMVAGIFSTGEEVLQRFNEANPDLILMDIRLKGSLDGIQTAIAIHNSIKAIPVIFVTAHARDQYPEITSLQSSLIMYVTKPFRNETLLKSVKKLLGISSK
jgi:two-component system, response regulator PdtaR